MVRLIRNVGRAVRSLLGRNVGEAAGQHILQSAQALQNINLKISSVNELYVHSPELLRASQHLADAIQNARVQVGLDEQTITVITETLAEIARLENGVRILSVSWERGLKYAGSDAAGSLLHCVILTHALASNVLSVVVCGIAMWFFMKAFRNEVIDSILYFLGGCYLVIIMLKLSFFPDFHAAEVSTLLEGLDDETDNPLADFVPTPTTTPAAAGAAIAAAPPLTVMLREVFRLRTGTFTTSAQTFTSFAGATATVNLPHAPIQWQLQVNGHETAGYSKTMRFRLMLRDNRSGAHFYFPGEDGMVKYIFTEWCKLESCFFHGVHSQLIPAGDYAIHVQVACGTEGGAYSWNSAYGEMVLLMTTAE
jgi:hypothetical protein